MNQSENINELAEALSKAQGEMQAAIKDSVNPFFKSKYADLGSVWDAARPVLSKNGLCVIQSTEIINDKIVMVTMLAHNSGQWIKSYLPLNPSKNDCQGVGAAITYLRRYSLSALVGVVCDDDDDGNKDAQLRQQQPKYQNVPKTTKSVDKTCMESSNEFSHIFELIKQADSTCVRNMCNWLKDKYKIQIEDNLNIESYRDVPQEEYDTMANSLNRNIEMNKRNKQAVA